MPGPKAIQRIPNFSMEDVERRFACWLQKRCREQPGFEAEIADVTFTSSGTVQQWKYGQLPGREAFLRALAYGGPRAVNEVLLDPMGMAGARYVGEDLTPIVERAFAARREVAGILQDLGVHPDSAACEKAIDQLLNLVIEATGVTQQFLALRRARGKPEVVEMPERGKRA